MFHRFRRRPSPAAAIAGLALFVALSGTAVAQSDILITSPNQLGSNVVTSPKIAQRAISTGHVLNESLSDVDLRDPQLKVRAVASGGQLPDSDGTSVRGSQGTYNVTFNASTLNAGNATPSDTLLNNNCAFTATSRDSLAMMTIAGPFNSAPNTVVVTAAFPNERVGRRADECGRQPVRHPRELLGSRDILRRPAEPSLSPRAPRCARGRPTVEPQAEPLTGVTPADRVALIAGPRRWCSVRPVGRRSAQAHVGSRYRLACGERSARDRP